MDLLDRVPKPALVGWISIPSSGPADGKPRQGRVPGAARPLHGRFARQRASTPLGGLNLGVGNKGAGPCVAEGRGGAGLVGCGGMPAATQTYEVSKMRLGPVVPAK